MTVSDKIREKLRIRNKEVEDFKKDSSSRPRPSGGGDYSCNDNISEFIDDGDLDLLIEEVAGKFQEVLNSLIIDTENDHNTKETANRVARMFITETLSGRYNPKPKITAFPNHLEYDQLYVTGPISIRSVCAHHFQNIVGRCWIGVWPGQKVIGLSKFNRLVDWIASRPTIQEEMTIQIGEEVQQATEADAVAVIVKATHHCMTMRGVKEHESDMTTSIMKGKFQDDPSLKNEFFQILNGMKGFRE